jgi:hypothetical protein
VKTDSDTASEYSMAQVNITRRLKSIQIAYTYLDYLHIFRILDCMHIFGLHASSNPHSAYTETILSETYAQEKKGYQDF